MDLVAAAAAAVDELQNGFRTPGYTRSCLFVGVRKLYLRVLSRNCHIDK